MRWIFFKTAGSGLHKFGLASDKLTYLVENFQSNLSSLELYLGGRPSPALGVLCLAVPVALFVVSWRTATPRARLAIGALLLGFFLNLSWWILFSDTTWVRHLIPGITLGVAAVIVMLTQVREAKLRVALALALIAISTPRLKDVPTLRLLTWQPSGRQGALVRTKNFVAKLPFNEVQLVGYGWWVSRELEFLLPGSLNFKDARQSQGISSKRQILVRSESGTWENDPKRTAFEKQCEARILFEAPPFTVSDCSASERPAGESPLSKNL